MVSQLWAGDSRAEVVRNQGFGRSKVCVLSRVRGTRGAEAGALLGERKAGGVCEGKCKN